MGFEGRSRWSLDVVKSSAVELEGKDLNEVREIDEPEERLVLVEDSMICCPVLLMPFITATMGTSHKEMHLSFTRSLEGQNGQPDRL
jgi:hypothetical protein